MSHDVISDLFEQVQNHISRMAENIEFETCDGAVALLANCHLAQIKLTEITSKLAVNAMRKVLELENNTAN